MKRYLFIFGCVSVGMGWGYITDPGRNVLLGVIYMGVGFLLAVSTSRD